MSEEPTDQKLDASVTGIHASASSDKQGSVDVAEGKQLDEAELSLQYTQFEHSLKFWPAAKIYYPAVFWCLYVNLAVILSGYDGALIGSLAGLQPFTKTYGNLINGEYFVPPAWLSAFNYAAMVGGIIGALGAGYSYDRFGPRTTLFACSIGSIGSILIQFFSQTPAVLFVGEFFNGIVIGFYPIIASSYIGETCPVALRGVVGSVVNLSFVIGQLIASGLLKGTSTLKNEWSYKIPYASQWVLPLVVLSLIYWCPTPPYWLCRKGRYQEAERTLRRLSTKPVNIPGQLANINETLRLEENEEGNFLYTDCFHGSNLRRLMISVMVFNIQALCGNILFINYAVYFFEIAGLSADDAFSMNIGLTGIGFVGTCLFWPLLTYTGRRNIFICGTAGLTVLVFLIGILDVVPRTTSGPGWGQCSLIVIANLFYDLSAGPLCFTVLCEISAAKVRGATIALANVSVTIVSIVFAVAIPYALDVNGANWRGKLGFLFAGLGVLNVAWCYFCLPESKGRTTEELDIMFQRGVSTRAFKSYNIVGASDLPNGIDGGV